MEKIFFKADFYIADDGDQVLHHLVIHEPMLTDEGDGACVVSITPLLKGEKKIIGLDESQARDLAIEFVRNMLSGYKLAGAKGERLLLEDILP